MAEGGIKFKRGIAEVSRLPAWGPQAPAKQGGVGRRSRACFSRSAPPDPMK